MMLPLPAGEGWGEGEAAAHLHRCGLNWLGVQPPRSKLPALLPWVHVLAVGFSIREVVVVLD